jgi:uncharacterized membrane protein YhhN
MALTAALRLDQYCWICFGALLLHSAADYLMEFNMYLGAGFFLAGHICYICFFTHLFPVSGLHLIVLLCLLGIVIFLLWRWRRLVGKQLPFFAIYGVVLSITAACAIAGLSAHTLQGQMIALGGALFFPPFFESLYDVRLAVVLLDGWRQCGYGVKNPDADGYRDDDVVVDLQVFEERFKRIHVYEYIL